LAITSSPPPCKDTKYNLQGVKQKSTLKWSYKSATTPSYLTTSGVVTILKRAFGNITGERNDCGRGDTVSATSSYLGTTSHGIGVTSGGACGTADGNNTLGFGSLPSGYLALTCIRSIGTQIVEIDTKFSTNVHWSLSLSGCFNSFMLESVATHEMGHAYGMAHVGETYHGRLTMSTYIDGTCENQESTLGLGDMKGLEAMY
jgi:Matrixin